MTRLHRHSLCLSLSLTVGLFAGCHVGENDDSLAPETEGQTDNTSGDAPTPEEHEDSIYLDTDGDGRVDSLDIDGDGIADYFLGNLDVDPSTLCADPLVDSDSDGEVDGIDLDCDGNIDISIADLPSGDNVSQCSTAVNGNQIDCESVDGEPYLCDCSVDGTVVSTCTTDSDNACSQPGDNCCGF